MLEADKAVLTFALVDADRATSRSVNTAQYYNSIPEYHDQLGRVLEQSYFVLRRRPVCKNTDVLGTKDSRRTILFQHFLLQRRLTA